MLVFDNKNEVLMIDNIYSPTASDHFWVLDLNMMDYTLSPLLVLEELVCSTVELLIWGFKFKVPAHWSILVVDDETMQLDVVDVGKELAGTEFRTLVHGPNRPNVDCALVQVTDYFPSYRNVGPSLNKHQMLCHPISPDAWINISPSDTYKYLKNAVAGDLI